MGGARELYARPRKSDTEDHALQGSISVKFLEKAKVEAGSRSVSAWGCRKTEMVFLVVCRCLKADCALRHLHTTKNSVNTHLKGVNELAGGACLQLKYLEDLGRRITSSRPS
jgi:hypothetical protein